MFEAEIQKKVRLIMAFLPEGMRNNRLLRFMVGRFYQNYGEGRTAHCVRVAIMETRANVQPLIGGGAPPAANFPGADFTGFFGANFGQVYQEISRQISPLIIRDPTLSMNLFLSNQEPTEEGWRLLDDMLAVSGQVVDQLVQPSRTMHVISTQRIRISGVSPSQRELQAIPTLFPSCYVELQLPDSPETASDFDIFLGLIDWLSQLPNYQTIKSWQVFFARFAMDSSPDYDTLNQSLRGLFSSGGSGALDDVNSMGGYSSHKKRDLETQWSALPKMPKGFPFPVLFDILPEAWQRQPELMGHLDALTSLTELEQEAAALNIIRHIPPACLVSPDRIAVVNALIRGVYEGAGGFAALKQSVKHDGVIDQDLFVQRLDQIAKLHTIIIGSSRDQRLLKLMALVIKDHTLSLSEENMVQLRRFSASLIDAEHIKFLLNLSQQDKFTQRLYDYFNQLGALVCRFLPEKVEQIHFEHLTSLFEILKRVSLYPDYFPSANRDSKLLVSLTLQLFTETDSVSMERIIGDQFDEGIFTYDQFEGCNAADLLFNPNNPEDKRLVFYANVFTEENIGRAPVKKYCETGGLTTYESMNRSFPGFSSQIRLLTREHIDLEIFNILIKLRQRVFNGGEVLLEKDVPFRLSKVKQQTARQDAADQRRRAKQEQDAKNLKNQWNTRLTDFLNVKRQQCIRQIKRYWHKSGAYQTQYDALIGAKTWETLIEVAKTNKAKLLEERRWFAKPLRACCHELPVMQASIKDVLCRMRANLAGYRFKEGEMKNCFDHINTLCSSTSIEIDRLYYEIGKTYCSTQFGPSYLRAEWRFFSRWRKTLMGCCQEFMQWYETHRPKNAYVIRNYHKTSDFSTSVYDRNAYFYSSFLGDYEETTQLFVNENSPYYTGKQPLMVELTGNAFAQKSADETLSDQHQPANQTSRMSGGFSPAVSTEDLLASRTTGFNA